MMRYTTSLLSIFLITSVFAPIASAQANADDDFLVHALNAERFIASLKVETPEGTLWRSALDSDAEPGHSLYYGSGGIALFYFELHKATGDKRFYDIAASAGEGILTAIKRNETEKISMSSGLAAEAFVLGELYRQTKDERFADGARVSLGRLKAKSEPLGSGVGWIEKNPYEAYNAANTNVGEMYDLSIGAAGAGVTFLEAYRSGLDDEGKAWAVKAADRLLEVAEHTDDGLRWPMMDNLPATYIMPNFAHGPAGIAYFLADLYQETKTQAYLDAAISAAEYVQSRAVVKGDGVLVCHHERPDPADLFYLGYCHGPAGTGRLMYKLYEISGDEKWLNWIESNVRGFVATGAPEKRSEGLWNNMSQCCGDSGMGDFAVYMYRATKKSQYLDLARDIAQHIRSEGHLDNGKLSWSQAEMRIRPEALQTQTGYMQGAAGIGSFFLHLATVKDDPVKIRLLATPFE